MTADEVRQKRHIAAMRLLFAFVKELPGDRDLYAMNLRGDLSEVERAQLIAVLLDTFPADIAEQQLSAWFSEAGSPMPSFDDNYLADARFWSGMACAKELGAYAIACFENMSDKRKREFAQWVNAKVPANG